MSDERIDFQTLAALARREPAPPAADVLQAVTARLAAASAAETGPDWLLWGATGFSTAAAAAVLLCCLHLDALPGDPLADWINVLTAVTL